MQNTPIIITGSQRSGTTLLSLILNSHPNILSVDEMAFDYPDINTYLNAEWLPSFISFKLPRYAPMLSFIKDLIHPRVIWCIRDPIDTVWSMIKLQLKLDASSTVSWAAHQRGAQIEILNSYWTLNEEIKLDLAQYMKRFFQIINKTPKERNRQDSIFAGALCWRIKNELPLIYKSQRINFHTVMYEDIVTTPKETIKGILDHIGLPWSDDVLRHHELHDGISVGNTINTRPIDSSGIGNGVKNLTQEEIELIKAVCNKTAMKWNYLTER